MNISLSDILTFRYPRDLTLYLSAVAALGSSWLRLPNSKSRDITIEGSSQEMKVSKYSYVLGLPHQEIENKIVNYVSFYYLLNLL